MAEEEDAEIFTDDFMKQVIEDGSSNARQAYSVITSLLPSHQATAPSQEKNTQTLLLKTLRKQKYQQKQSPCFDRTDTKYPAPEFEPFWEDNFNLYADDDEAFIFKLMMIQSMPLPMTMKRKHK